MGRADIKFKDPQPGVAGQRSDRLGAIGSGIDQTCRDEAAIAGGFLVDRGEGGEPVRGIPLDQPGAVEQRYPRPLRRRAGRIKADVVSLVELPRRGHLFINRFSNHASGARMQSGADAGLRHHRFAGTADNRIEQWKGADSRGKTGHPRKLATTSAWRPAADPAVLTIAT